MLEPGLYEQVINKQIQSELQGSAEDLKLVEKIDGAEASEVLARYVSEIVHKALDRISEDGDLTAKYVSHYGSRPMSITWHLDNAIPAKHIKKTSKLEVG